MELKHTTAPRTSRLSIVTDIQINKICRSRVCRATGSDGYVMPYSDHGLYHELQMAYGSMVDLLSPSSHGAILYTSSAVKARMIQPTPQPTATTKLIAEMTCFGYAAWKPFQLWFSGFLHPKILPSFAESVPDIHSSLLDIDTACSGFSRRGIKLSFTPYSVPFLRHSFADATVIEFCSMRVPKHITASKTLNSPLPSRMDRPLPSSHWPLDFRGRQS